MKVTARHVRAVYALFRQVPPHSGWNLPPPEKLSFGVNNARKEFGHYEWDGNRRRIEISRHNVKTLPGLVIVMAHEILHLRQELTKTYSDRSQHNRAFLRLAKRVCLALGFESKGFT